MSRCPSKMRESEYRGPRRSLVLAAIHPGDEIYVLNENEEYIPEKVLQIAQKSIITERSECLFEDHGWLWRCLKPKEG